MLPSDALKRCRKEGTGMEKNTKKQTIKSKRETKRVLKRFREPRSSAGKLGSARTVGRTPWSAADALVGLCVLTTISHPRESRPGGRLQTRGAAPLIATH